MHLKASHEPHANQVLHSGLLPSNIWSIWYIRTVFRALAIFCFDNTSELHCLANPCSDICFCSFHTSPRLFIQYYCTSKIHIMMASTVYSAVPSGANSSVVQCTCRLWSLSGSRLSSAFEICASQCCSVVHWQWLVVVRCECFNELELVASRLNVTSRQPVWWCTAGYPEWSSKMNHNQDYPMKNTGLLLSTNDRHWTAVINQWQAVWSAVVNQ